jgi:hypothetical protein
MIYAGIDVSKYKHDCFILSEFGEVVKDVFTFANTADGFAQLKKTLDELGYDNVRIGFESTGHYAVNLKLFLEKNGFEFTEINPYLIKKWLEGNSLRQTYTDKICAKALIQLTNILDCVFPEFKPFLGGKFSVTALYILAHYQSAENIANINSQSYDKLRRVSRGHFSTHPLPQSEVSAKFLLP